MSNNAPETMKMYLYKFKGKTYWTSNENCSSFPGGLPSEYIRKDIADAKEQKLLETFHSKQLQIDELEKKLVQNNDQFEEILQPIRDMLIKEMISDLFMVG